MMNYFNIKKRPYTMTIRGEIVIIVLDELLERVEKKLNLEKDKTKINELTETKE